MRPTPIPPALRRRPFTLAEARAVGLSERTLRGQRFRRMFSRVYVCADVADSPLLRLDGALLIAPPRGFATCESAGHLWGAPVCDPLVPHVGLPARMAPPRVRGVAWHQYTQLPPVTLRHRRPVVAASSAFVQIAVHRGLLDAVIAGDAMVRRGHTSPAEMVRAAAELRGRPGGRVRRAAALVRSRVDSPMETWLRLLIVLCGLPEPEVNGDVVRDDGFWVAIPDLRYAQYKIAIEYDGHHHLGSAQYQSDIYRNANLEADGWIVIVVTAHELYRRPDGTVHRVAAALRRRGHAVAPDLAQAWQWLGTPSSSARPT